MVDVVKTWQYMQKRQMDVDVVARNREKRHW